MVEQKQAEMLMKEAQAKELLAKEQTKLLKLRLTCLEEEVTRSSIKQPPPLKHDAEVQAEFVDTSAAQMQGLVQEKERVDAEVMRLNEKLSRMRESSQKTLEMLLQAEMRATKSELNVIERPCTPEEVQLQLAQLETVYLGEIALLKAQLEEARQSAGDFSRGWSVAQAAELLQAQEDAAKAWLQARDKDWELRRVRTETEMWRQMAPGSAVERQKARDYDQLAAENARLTRLCHQMEESSHQQRILLEKQLSSSRQRSLTIQDLVGAVERLKADLQSREREVEALSAQVQDMETEQRVKAGETEVFTALCRRFLESLSDAGFGRQWAGIAAHDEFINTYFPEILAERAKTMTKMVDEDIFPSREEGVSASPQKEDAFVEPNEHFAATLRKCSRFRCFCTGSRVPSPERHRIYLNSGIAHSPLK